MTRILADLADEDIAWLDRRAEREGKSRAAILREAVQAYRSEAVSQQNLAWLDEGFGAWRNRADMGDLVEWQRRERAGWTRPWDDDYEEVKASFPELFDAEDDRQRQIYLAMIAGKAPAPRGRGSP